MTQAAPLPMARPEEVGLSPERLARLDAVLRGEVDRLHLPGVVALVARDGRVAHQLVHGVRDPSSGAPMRLDSIFRVYSMTKPMVSVALMMLVEQGRLQIGDPVSKFIPEFADQKVAEERGGKVELRPASQPSTVQDMLRHTSGLTYEFRGTGHVHRAYLEAKVNDRRLSNEEAIAALGRLPLLRDPGTRWEYSRSTDVVGRIVEVVSGHTLAQFLTEHVAGPLRMVDTAFWVPGEQHSRIAEPFGKDPDTEADVRLNDVRKQVASESGGGGLVSTATDYMRFVQMIANGGTLDGVRLLGRKTVEFMTADHLGEIPGTCDLLPPGHGFGLGFAVRTATGLSAVPGSVGTHYWGGIAGTTFWVDPVEKLTALLLVQAPGQREYVRGLFRNLVYATLV